MAVETLHDDVQLWSTLNRLQKVSNCSSKDLVRLLDALSTTVESMEIRNSTAATLTRLLLAPVQAPTPIAPSAAPVSWLNILFAALLLTTSVAVSVILGLKLHKKLLASAARCVVQLLLGAIILGLVFSHPQVWLVVLYGIAMAVVTAFETLSRPPYTYKGMLVCVMVVMGCTCSLFMLYALLLCIPVRPWWSPSTFIPILGFMLAQATSGISSGLSMVLDELARDCDRIEMMLSFGANRFECSLGVIQAGCAAALKPLVSHMSVMGIVGIPELMMGQLIGGAQPGQAARYQIIITLLSFASTSVAVVLTVTLATLSLVDQRSRLLRDKLISREQRESGIEPWLQAQATKLLKATHTNLSRCLVRFHLACCSGGIGQRWRNRSLSIFNRTRNKFKRSSVREEIDYGDDQSLGSRLQDVIFSDDEGYMEQDAPMDAAAEQPLLPTLAPDLTINTRISR